eukprot:CAMPEP_0114547596 /NCGR_PEP_ID=MMETSP0114-20121206/4544_1 /TAXON_ID=31324 /ORGANISM="Goniomonas sp, Strain m" /LENGTH=642 /DNA_ID=CAMNT_0001732153 /DNA_START=124 /DNA_END=2052 /DNA_ORIENTATION=+
MKTFVDHVRPPPAEIEGSKPKSNIRNSTREVFNLEKSDIAGSNVGSRLKNQISYTSKRRVNPLAPVYPVASCEILPVPEPRFLRDSMVIDDIPGSRTQTSFQYRTKQRVTMDTSDIPGTQADSTDTSQRLYNKPMRQPDTSLDVHDIVQKRARWHTRRETDVMSPRYLHSMTLVKNNPDNTVSSQRVVLNYGKVDGSHVSTNDERYPPKSNPSTTLMTDDIFGASLAHRRVLHPNKDSLNVSDIQGARREEKIGTFHNVPIRRTHPLEPDYTWDLSQKPMLSFVHSHNKKSGSSNATPAASARPVTVDVPTPSSKRVEACGTPTAAATSSGAAPTPSGAAATPPLAPASARVRSGSGTPVRSGSGAGTPVAAAGGSGTLPVAVTSTGLVPALGVNEDRPSSSSSVIRDRRNSGRGSRRNSQDSQGGSSTDLLKAGGTSTQCWAANGAPLGSSLGSRPSSRSGNGVGTGCFPNYGAPNLDKSAGNLTILDQTPTGLQSPPAREAPTLATSTCNTRPPSAASAGSHNKPPTPGEGAGRPKRGATVGFADVTGTILPASGPGSTRPGTAVSSKPGGRQHLGLLGLLTGHGEATAEGQQGKSTLHFRPQSAPADRGAPTKVRTSNLQVQRMKQSLAEDIEAVRCLY